MLALLRAVQRGGARAPGAAKDRFSEACQAHVRKGGEVRGVTVGTILGRSVNRSGFISYLWREFPAVFSTMLESEKFVARIETGPTPITAHEATATLSILSSWVTWNLTDPHGDPFAFATTGHSDEVRANLGLLARRKGPSPRLLLLTYEHRGSIELLRPTVADAMLYPFFSPPVDGEDNHGWTVPWPREEISHLPSTTELASRPEAVHASISVGELRTPIRCLK
jgi:hypothetical protein